ncbi:MAG: CHASE2 domain-containing protein, partial [Cyanobacteria bacterium]|nr:CHASE2 domain-containing protein [Cyanobacteriota bacterium]MDW8203160.1 CHASE2 domain-containing protein [Cyanobacteriota bacterium SKYGB_h_bin112]
WQALQLLKSLAVLCRLTWPSQEQAMAIKDRILQTIGDELGWDMLVFVGHSQETAVTGGRVMITPQVALATSELETALTRACDRGLRLAIFNSCSSLNIAQSLVQLGLQVVAMREPIRTDVAQQFLHHLCHSLANHQTIQSAVYAACQHLRTTQQFAYPSTDLLPLLFSPAQAPPFQFAPPRWQQWLQSFRLSRQWLPTPLEAIVLAVAVLVSSMDGVISSWLLDLRYLSQAVYYDLTNQVPSQIVPPVLLIGIDQESIDRAQRTIPNFKTFPIDRRYLAKIVADTASLEARVVGIDYFLDTEQPHEQQLTQAIEASVAYKNTWFVFAVNDKDKLHDSGNRLQWSLRGDVRYHYPSAQDGTCHNLCPFTYLLAIAKILSQASFHQSYPQPQLEHQGDFQLAVSGYLRQWLNRPDQSPIAPLQVPNLPLGLSTINDFALPLETAYRFIPAWQFLEQAEPDSAWARTVTQPIVLIASWGYGEAEDTFSAYLSTQYWCKRRQQLERDCSTIFGGENIAQALRDLLIARPIVRIPDRWLVPVAAVVTKGVTLHLSRRSQQQRYRLMLLFLGVTGLYGLVSLQLYNSAAVLMPWLLPSMTSWIYLGLALNRKG